MARDIPDINGSAMNTLRSVKLNDKVSTFRSTLQNEKFKSLAEEVVKAVADTLHESKDAQSEYILNLLSKTDDNILGRIGTKLAALDEDTLESLKTDIEEYIDQQSSNAQESSDETQKDLDAIQQVLNDNLVDKTSLIDGIVEIFNNIESDKRLEKLKEYLKSAESEANAGTSEVEEAAGGESQPEETSSEDAGEEVEAEQTASEEEKTEDNAAGTSEKSSEEDESDQKDEILEEIKNVKNIVNKILTQTTSIYNRIFRFSRIFSRMSNAISRTYNMLKDKTMDLLKKIAVKFNVSKFGDILSRFGKSIARSFTTIREKITSKIASLKTATLKIVKAPFIAIGKKISNVKKAFSNGIKGIAAKVANVKAAFSNGFEKIGQGFRGLFSRNKDKKPGEKKKKSTSILGKIGEVIKNIGRFIGQIVEAILVPIFRAIGNAIGALLQPIFAAITSFLWASGIMVMLLIISTAVLLIAAGIFVLSLAVKKFMDILEEYADELPPEQLASILDKVAFGIATVGLAISAAILAFSSTAMIIGAIGEVIQLILMLIRPFIEKIAKAIGVFLDTVWPIIETVVKFIGNILVEIFNNVIVPIWNVIKSIIVPILQLIGKVIEVIGKAIELVVNIIAGIFDFILSIIDFIIELPGKIVDWIKKLWGFVKGLPGKIFNFIKALPSKIWGFIKGALSKIVQPLAKIKIFGFRPFKFLAGGSSDTEDVESKDEDEDEDEDEDKVTIDDVFDKVKLLQDTIAKMQSTIDSQMLKKLDDISNAKMQSIIASQMLKKLNDISKTLNAVKKLVLVNAGMNAAKSIVSAALKLPNFLKSKLPFKSSQEVSNQEKVEIQQNGVSNIGDKIQTVDNINNIANGQSLDTSSIEALLNTSTSNLSSSIADGIDGIQNSANGRHQTLLEYLAGEFKSINGKLDSPSIIPIPIENRNQALADSI